MSLFHVLYFTHFFISDSFGHKTELMARVSCEW